MGHSSDQEEGVGSCRYDWPGCRRLPPLHSHVSQSILRHEHYWMRGIDSHQRGGQSQHQVHREAVAIHADDPAQCAGQVALGTGRLLMDLQRYVGLCAVVELSGRDETATSIL